MVAPSGGAPAPGCERAGLQHVRNHRCHKPHGITGAGVAPTPEWRHGVATLQRRHGDSCVPAVRSPRPRSASGGIRQGAGDQRRNGARGTGVSGLTPGGMAHRERPSRQRG